ncbi:MAG: DUF4347 domain-containing protein [Microcoleus sp. SU_5_3]|nr:DUF4347 domain-containing protein [Microcoleus sp. SU_5_3]
MSTKSIGQVSARSIAFIDSQVEDYQSLVAGVMPGTEAIVIDSRADGVAQITQVLTNRTKIDSIHIVSHGSPGCLQLGKTQLCSHNVETYRKQLRQWRHALNLYADILIYGCNVAAETASDSLNSEPNSTSELDAFETSVDSAHLLQRIAALTGANIAASTNLTGSADKGGDWELEYTTGDISASLAFKPETLATYDRVLSNYTLYDGITNNTTSYSGDNYFSSDYGYRYNNNGVSDYAGLGVLGVSQQPQALTRLRYIQIPTSSNPNIPLFKTGVFSLNSSINTASISGGNTGIIGFSTQDIELPPQPSDDPKIGSLPQPGKLDNPYGYTLLFNLALTSETSEANRSGFSVIAPGIELGFKSTEIFAQSTPNPNEFVPEEKAELPAGFNLAAFNKYVLSVTGNWYQLFVNDSPTPILTGPRRYSYSFTPPASSFGFNPYSNSNPSIFLGDSDDRGSSTFRLGKVSIANEPIVVRSDRVAITANNSNPNNPPANVNPRSITIDVLANDFGGAQSLKVKNVFSSEPPVTYGSPPDDSNNNLVAETQSNSSGMRNIATVNDWIYIGGKFTEIDGTPRNNIARLNSNGTLDATFNPNAITVANPSLPNDPNFPTLVSDIAIGDDGNPIVSGTFNNIGGLNRTNLAKLNTTDGKADPKFDSSNPNSFYAPSEISNSKIAIDRNGNLLINRSFSVGSNINITRLDSSSGKPDRFFTNENNQGDEINSIAIDANNNPVIAGKFSQIGMQPRNHIARLNSDGTADTNFVPDPNIAAIYQKVNGLAIDANGKLVISGTQNDSIPQQQAYNSPIRLNASGTIDSTFNFNIGAGKGEVIFDSNGKILVGDSTPIVRLNNDGTVDPTFNNNPSNSVGAIAIDSNNNIIFASRVPGTQTSTHIGKILGSNNNSNYGYNYGIDPYDTPFNNPNALNINGSVSDIEIDRKRSITYTPAPGFNGFDFFYYTATDGYSNSNDPPNKMAYENSSFYGILKPQPYQNRVTVLVNDSPVLDNSGTPSLTNIIPYDTNNRGTLILELIDRLGGTKITDPNDAISPRTRGIAITNLNTTNGRWQYTTDDTNWIDFAFPTEPGVDRNPLLLPSNSTTRIRFIPNNGYIGTVTDAITFHAWDGISTLDRQSREIAYPNSPELAATYPFQAVQSILTSLKT